jgi:hypothetical protein
MREQPHWPVPVLAHLCQHVAAGVDDDRITEETVEQHRPDREPADDE